MTFKINVQGGKCHGCGNCVIVCPANSFSSASAAGGKGPDSEDIALRIENGTAHVVDADLCNGCGTCVLVCPVDAIEVLAEEIAAVELVMLAREVVRERPEIISAEGIVPVIEEMLVERYPEITPEKIAAMQEDIESVVEACTDLKVRFLLEKAGKIDKAKEEFAKKVKRK